MRRILRYVVSLVIPGRRAAASPESMNTGPWNLDSGFDPLGRPGMTPRRWEELKTPYAMAFRIAWTLS
jgi:hypothetical protein